MQRFTLSLDARIQESVVDNLAARPAPVAVGPFIIGVDPGTDSPGINYATPRPGHTITPADITALVTAFRTAERKPRLEYVTSTAPDLEHLLLNAGFAVEERHDYLVCSPGSLRVPPIPDGFRVLSPANSEQRIAMVNAQNEAFGGEPTATEQDAERIAHLQDRGGVAFMAIDAVGVCVGGGMATPPNGGGGGTPAESKPLGGSRESERPEGRQASEPADGQQGSELANGGVSEVTGIAVGTAYRRRGLAAAITGAITVQLFGAGVEVAWLEASGPDSWRIYERVGYRPSGKRLYMCLDRVAG